MFNSNDLEKAAVSQFTAPEPKTGIVGDAIMDVMMEMAGNMAAIRNKHDFKFDRFDLIMHYKGGFYYVVGLPDEYVIEATREPAYAYLMQDGRVCIRSQEEMESNLKDGQTPRFFKITPGHLKHTPETMDKIRNWIFDYHEKMAKNIVNGEAKAIKWTHQLTAA